MERGTGIRGFNVSRSMRHFFFPIHALSGSTSRSHTQEASFFFLLHRHTHPLLYYCREKVAAVPLRYSTFESKFVFTRMIRIPPPHMEVDKNLDRCDSSEVRTRCLYVGRTSELSAGALGRPAHVIHLCSRYVVFLYTHYTPCLMVCVYRSQEGSQFCKGFGGIGGILRWRVDFAEMDESNYEDVEDWGEGF